LSVRLFVPNIHGNYHHWVPHPKAGTAVRCPLRIMDEAKP
jgi:hypothetical protein